MNFIEILQRAQFLFSQRTDCREELCDMATHIGYPLAKSTAKGSGSTVYKGFLTSLGNYMENQPQGKTLRHQLRIEPRELNYEYVTIQYD